MLSGASGGKGRRLNETEEEARAAEAANAARRPKSAFRRGLFIWFLFLADLQERI